MPERKRSTHDDFSSTELRALLETQGQQFMEVMDHWMSEHDRDVNPNVTGTGRKASGVGLYYFEDNNIEEKSS